jgi:hypothetical protein
MEDASPLLSVLRPLSSVIRPMLDIINIRSHGEHPEESGKNILSLGHPGDGFHVERVKGKQSRYESALPGCLGHPVKNEKEQQRICNVEQEICQMVPSRFQSKELNIEHVGHPGHGMPVCGITGRKGPPNRLRCNTVPDMDVLSYVYIIVIINEIALTDLLERYDGSGRQKKVNQRNLLFC